MDHCDDILIFSVILDFARRQSTLASRARSERVVLQEAWSLDRQQLQEN
jgi:hypothetical protein